MKLKIFLPIILVLNIAVLKAQVITCDPVFPSASGGVTVTFYADQGSAGLKDYTGDVYAHMGLITSLSTGSSDWKYIVAPWSTNLPKAKMTRVSTNVYTITISASIKEFYGVTSTTEVIKKLAFVFRSSDGTKEGKTSTGGDIFYDVTPESAFVVKIATPVNYTSLVSSGDLIPVTVNASKGDSLKIFDNGTQLVKTNTLSASTTISAFGTGLHKILAKAWKSGVSAADSVYYCVKSTVTVEDVPAGMRPGVNVTGDNSATFVLYAPGKSYVYLIGDFNNWLYCDEGAMNKSTDGNYFWVSVSGLDPATEYGFQYMIDGSINIPDPYTTKVLDPSNDSYISSATYPNLKAYPTGKTTQLVSVFQTRPVTYQWKNTSFTPPAKENLVVYEMLVRDFVAAHNFNTIRDTLNYLTRLGVNAIEFMPVAEFEGNSSWGYNPSMYFAVDKYYGPANTFKELIDSCHSRGIVVIMDMVLNHAYGSNPLVRMYYDKTTYKVTADNPWFNVNSPNSSYSWGYDFNHESKATQAFVDSVNHYWINEFKVDGFRFDFTKGFTNTVSTDGYAYDASRIAILERMGNKIRSYKPDAYLILEHFTENTEEKVLANDGFMLWGNCKGQYEEASMGYSSTFNAASYKNLAWDNPRIMDYMESHDEERIMYKDINYGNINTSTLYSVKDFSIAVRRVKLCAAFFFTMPGPKMLWQFEEVGYDKSKTAYGNTGEMPILWNYYGVAERRNIFDNFAALIKLKKENATFSTSNYTLYETGNLKRLNLISTDMDAVVLGNFDVSSGLIGANFSRTGKWYDFFSGDSLDVTAATQNQNIYLAAGEYRLYTSKRLKRPSFLTPVEDVHSSADTDEPFILFPNPFKDNVLIRIESDEQVRREIDIYSITGALMRVYSLPEGMYEQAWDGCSSNGKKVPPGIYIVRISAGGKHSYGKLMVN
jgi:glycosidase